MTTPTPAPRGAAASLSAASRSGNGRNATDGQTRGAVTSGVFPNRDNTSASDAEQKRREQVRDETRWARGLRSTHPSYTRTNSDTNPGVVGNSNLSREAAADSMQEEYDA